MNRTPEFKLYETTYSFLPCPMNLASLIGIQIGGRPPRSPPGDWRVSGVGRQFIRPGHVVESIRSIHSPDVALSEELVYRPGVVYSGFRPLEFHTRRIFDIEVTPYIDIPKMKPPRRDETVTYDYWEGGNQTRSPPNSTNPILAVFNLHAIVTNIEHAFSTSPICPYSPFGRAMGRAAQGAGGPAQKTQKKMFPIASTHRPFGGKITFGEFECLRYARMIVSKRARIVWLKQ